MRKLFLEGVRGREPLPDDLVEAMPDHRSLNSECIYGTPKDTVQHELQKGPLPYDVFKAWDEMLD